MTLSTLSLIELETLKTEYKKKLSSIDFEKEYYRYMATQRKLTQISCELGTRTAKTKPATYDPFEELTD